MSMFSCKLGLKGLSVSHLPKLIDSAAKKQDEFVKELRNYRDAFDPSPEKHQRIASELRQASSLLQERTKSNYEFTSEDRAAVKSALEHLRQVRREAKEK